MKKPQAKKLSLNRETVKALKSKTGIKTGLGGQSEKDCTKLCNTWEFVSEGCP
jgi:hypothetical protein